jgi:WD40 repeat protein
VATGTAPLAREGSVSSGVSYDGFVSYSHAADGLLAPRLQAGLQRFAKPWWRRRALRIFRDESSLSANPHLWSSIAGALDGSEWFVLLTGPEAAQSEWVDKEVSYWLEHKDPERILPVLTGGGLSWDEASGRLDASSSVPPALLGAFSEEPRWVDMRWADGDVDLDLHDSRFRGAVADIASAIRGVPKDDLESEEVRQHRRTIRTAWGAAGLLAVFAVAAVVAALYADGQRQEADDQRAEAEVQRLEADAQRAEAEAQRLVAEEQTEVAQINESRAESEAERAVSAESLARSRELAASAINVLDDDPELSILLALEAIEAVGAGEEQPVESLSALREAVHSSPIIRRDQVAPSGYVWLALSPDGSRLATASEGTGVVRVVDTETWETVWEYSNPDTIDTVDVGEFSPDGEWLNVGYVDSTSVFAGFIPAEDAPDDDGLPARTEILDAATGSLVSTIEYPECPTSVMGEFSPDGRWLSQLTGTGAAEGWCSEWWVEIIDTDTWTTDRRIPVEGYTLSHWTAEGDVVLDISGDIVDIETLTVRDTLSEGVYGALTTPDGTKMVGIVGTRHVGVYDLATGGRVDQLTGFTQEVIGLWLSDDGSKLITPTNGAETVVFDLDSGEIAHRLTATGPAAEVAYDSERQLLYHAGLNGEVTIWDLSGLTQGELDSTIVPGQVAENQLHVTGEHGAYWSNVNGEDTAGIFKPGSNPDGSTAFQTSSRPVVLSDGHVVASLARGSRAGGDLEHGPVVFWDPATGATTEIAGCWAPAGELHAGGMAGQPCTDRDEEYTYYDYPEVSPDGEYVALGVPAVVNFIPVRETGAVIIHDRSGKEVQRHSVDSLMGLSDFGNGWIGVFSESEAWVLDLETGERVYDIGPAIIGFDAPKSEVDRSGNRLATGWSDGSLKVVDASTWTEALALDDAHGGKIKGLAFSPDAERLMTAGDDGLIKVWDLASGEETHRVPMDDVADGIWLDDQHIQVATAGGLWTTITLDTTELIELARSRLTREFTPAECATYRIDGCA